MTWNRKVSAWRLLLLPRTAFGSTCRRMVAVSRVLSPRRQVPGQFKHFDHDAAAMGYELSITIKGGILEVEADTVAQLEKRVAALDIPRLEAAMRKARTGKGATKAARRRA